MRQASEVSDPSMVCVLPEAITKPPSDPLFNIVRFVFEHVIPLTCLQQYSYRPKTPFLFMSQL